MYLTFNVGSIAKSFVAEENVSNEDRIGEVSEVLNKSDDKCEITEEGVMYDDEIKVLG